MINMHMSASSFRLAESKIGDNNYLGNDIFYPPDGRTGANCLLGTKTMIPIDGPVRENVGLLGSPAFEIPRMVDRDRDMNAVDRRADAPRRACARRTPTMSSRRLLFLLSRWMSLFAALVLWTAALAILRTLRRVLAVRRDCRAHRRSTSSSSSLLERASLALQATRAARSSRFTIRISGSTSGTGSCRNRRSRAVRRHAVPHHDASR